MRRRDWGCIDHCRRREGRRRGRPLIVGAGVVRAAADWAGIVRAAADWAAVDWAAADWAAADWAAADWAAADWAVAGWAAADWAVAGWAAADWAVAGWAVADWAAVDGGRSAVVVGRRLLSRLGRRHPVRLRALGGPGRRRGAGRDRVAEPALAVPVPLDLGVGRILIPAGRDISH
jgi:hypothetical protein